MIIVLVVVDVRTLKSSEAVIKHGVVVEAAAAVAVICFSDVD